VKIRSSSLFLRGISLLSIILAVVLTVFQLIRYSLLRGYYPPDMTIGGVAVGGVDPQTAQQRLLQVYSTPVEIHYVNNVFDLTPNVVGFQLDTESMLAAADLQRTGASFWGGFWDYLWNRRSPAMQIPLVSDLSEERLRAYLKDEISTRYDEPPIPAQPIPGTADFRPGTPGKILDINRAIVLIENALKSPTSRSVLLTSQAATPGRPPLNTLTAFLKQIIDQNNSDGITDVYFLNLQTGEELHFAYGSGQVIPINPDIAFSALSTIKIPIMVTTYIHYNSQLDDTTSQRVTQMISLSNNEASDALMQSMDPNRGPLIVSETMQKLGLNNTFMAGYFYQGAYLLRRFNTPANSRTDANTDPDVYEQTTPRDMGLLLEDLYQCSQTDGGALVAAFPGQINQAACQQMIQYLEQDKVGALIQTGVPDGTVVAHKHGWYYDVTTQEMNPCNDAAIIYSPGGNYILTIYSYRQGGIIFEDPTTHQGAQRMFADISRAVYNYMNLP
jgi:beta-lactamase class A